MGNLEMAAGSAMQLFQKQINFRQRPQNSTAGKDQGRRVKGKQEVLRDGLIRPCAVVAIVVHAVAALNRAAKRKEKSFTTTWRSTYKVPKGFKCSLAYFCFPSSILQTACQITPNLITGAMLAGIAEC